MFSPIGHRIIQLGSVDSTNNYAATLISEGQAEHGTVILAEEQTAGKGQRGAVWVSEPGLNLTFSVILKPANLSVLDQFMISRCVAVSLVHVLRKFGISGIVKWPNDILVGQKKIAGVLIESQILSGLVQSCIVGVGLNVNQSEFEGLNATSLKVETGNFIPLMEVLLMSVNEFEMIWKEMTLGSSEPIEREYLGMLYGTFGAVMMKDVNGTFEGLVEGTDRSGLLIVNVGGEKRKYDLKEISFLFQNES
jgi:BirA family biotin operon repressor/biotin-[acetyl-CoA-carboxylase] ligase